MGSPIIGYQRMSDPVEWEAVQQAYTHTCGFTRAWKDPYDPLLVWLYPECPVDAVITELQMLITGFTASAVAALTNLDAPDSDKHIRILKILEDITKMAVEWLNDKNTTEEISQFLQADNRLRTIILDELIALGAVQ